MGAEFESKINHDAVDLGCILLSSHHHHHQVARPPSFKPRTPAHIVPLPAFEGCGLVFELDRGMRSGKEEPGGTQDVGGPAGAFSPFPPSLGPRTTYTAQGRRL